jgi:hypothetical protein
MVRKLCLACGVLSSVLYVGMLVVAAQQWPSYSSASQTISEFSAIGAPTRPLWQMLGALYTLLVIVFGLGVWSGARANRVRRLGALIVGSRPYPARTVP